MLWVEDVYSKLGLKGEDFMDYVEPPEEWPPGDFDEAFPLPSPDELGIYAELPF